MIHCSETNKAGEQPCSVDARVHVGALGIPEGSAEHRRGHTPLTGRLER